MSLQHTAIQLLDHASEALNGIADGGIQPDDCRFASVKLSQAALRLSMEPLKREDLDACWESMQQALPIMQRLNDGECPGFYKGWVNATNHTFNATCDLLEGLASFYTHVYIEQPEELRLPGRLRRLLPAAWWGSR